MDQFRCRFMAPDGESPVSSETIAALLAEAAVEDNIALVQEADSITMNAAARFLQLNVPDAELARRRANWKPPAPRYARGVLAKHAKQVCSSSVGAVTH